MTHIRFISPFVFFLCLLFVSAAATYYFYNEKMRLDFETDQIKKRTLGEKGSLYLDQADLQGEIQILSTPIGYTVGPYEGTISAAKLGDSMRSTTAWVRRQTDQLRRINNIKSQHAIEFGSVSSIPADKQIQDAETLLDQFIRTIGPSIDFTTTDTGEPGSGVIADRPGLRRDLADLYRDLRAAISAQRTAINSDVDAIRGALSQIKSARAGASANSPEKIVFVREKYAEASDRCHQLILKLSYAKVGNNQVPIPGLTDSEAKRIAVQLWYYLHPSNVEILRRPATRDDGLPEDVNDATNIAFRDLAGDYYLAESERKFKTSPFYLDGITVEQIIDNQDLLIDTLLSQNRRLANELLLTLSIYHKIDAEQMLNGELDRRWEGTKNAINRNRVQIDNVHNNTSNLFNDPNDSSRDPKSLSRREDKEASRNRDTRLQAQNDVLGPLITFWTNEHRAVDQQVFALNESLQKLEEHFYQIKTGAIRQTGTVRKIGADGEIIWCDNIDRIYHINLGAGDHIKRGMRFIVYSDVGGKTEIKGLIEVTRLTTNNYAVCRLVVKYRGANEILVGDRIENRLYDKGRFLRVACIGKFEAPTTTYSQAEVEHHLRELGCEVQPEPSVNSELVILSQPFESMAPDTPAMERFVGAFAYRNSGLNNLLKLDTILVDEIMIYFEEP